ncbi:TPA: hypothetical protein NH928_005743 [Pseudomonas aeruginosa]|nr:hypothetical protein [Pseudomonas aeruginosa]
MLDNALAGKLVDRLAIDVQNLPGVGGFLTILAGVRLGGFGIGFRLLGVLAIRFYSLQ